jgi:hypothetical protein
VRELAPGLGLGRVKPAEYLGNRRVVELLGHRSRLARLPGGPQALIPQESGGVGFALRYLWRNIETRAEP